MKPRNLSSMHFAKLEEIKKLKSDTLNIKNHKKQKDKSTKVETYEMDYLFSVFDIMKNYDNNDTGDLFTTYLIRTGNAFETDLELDNQKCKDCDEYYDCVEGFNVCRICGTCVEALHHSETLSYKEMQEVQCRTRFTYEKESHLSEWLKRFQSRENKVIPLEVIEIVKNELKKERITEYSELSEEKVKKILKSLKLNEYYDNIITIINRLSGRPPFVLTREVDEKIKQMFSQIQYPFQLFKPKDRKNFLSYSYFLNKFFLILKLPEFSKYFKLLKSEEKLRQQDDIFVKIVEYMKQTDASIDWYFPPSF